RARALGERNDPVRQQERRDLELGALLGKLEGDGRRRDRGLGFGGEEAEGALVLSGGQNDRLVDDTVLAGLVGHHAAEVQRRRREGGLVRRKIELQREERIARRGAERTRPERRVR